MNYDFLFIRLMSCHDYEELKRNYKKHILCRELGDIRLVVVRKPDLIVPESLYKVSVRDVELELPRDKRELRELYDRAEWNTRVSMPPRIYFSEKIAGKDLYHTGVFMEEEYGYGCSPAVIDKKRSMSGMRLTNSSWFGGGVAAFYPGTAKRIADMLESDFYMTLPSIHEARIHSCRWTNVQEVHRAISHWNDVHYMKKGENIFSSCVFRFCKSRGEYQTVEYYDWNK